MYLLTGLTFGFRFRLPHLKRGLLTRSSGFRRPNRRFFSFGASILPLMKSVRFEAQSVRHLQIFCICAFPTALAKFCDLSKKSSTYMKRSREITVHMMSLSFRYLSLLDDL